MHHISLSFFVVVLKDFIYLREIACSCAQAGEGQKEREKQAPHCAGSPPWAWVSSLGSRPEPKARAYPSEPPGRPVHPTSYPVLELVLCCLARVPPELPDLRATSLCNDREGFCRAAGHSPPLVLLKNIAGNPITLGLDRRTCAIPMRRSAPAVQSGYSREEEDLHFEQLL